MRSYFISGLLLVVSVGLFISCGGEQKFEISGLELEIKEVPAQRVAYAEIIGPYEEIGDDFEAIHFWAAQRGVAEEAEWIGIFYDNPAMVEASKLKAEVAVTVPETFEPDSVYPVKTIPKMKVASVVLQGSYEEIPERYPEIYGWLAQNNYSVVGPLYEVYLKGGPDIPESEYLTEVRIPVEKVSG